MRYTTFDLLQRTAHVVSEGYRVAHHAATHPRNPLSRTLVGRFQAAVLESISRGLRTYPKRGFRLNDAVVDGRTLPVIEKTLVCKPFCNLVRFECPGVAEQPKLLLIAALSGHYASLLRDTVAAFLPDHDVHVTDWVDARDVSIGEGSFGFDEYVSYLIEFLETLGPDTHVVAVCQPAVQALIATAVMAGSRNPSTPKTLTLMAGPIDTRINPTRVYRLASFLGMRYFRNAMIARVPDGYRGAGRRVYPGQTQLASFISVNATNHLRRFGSFFMDVLRERHAAAAKHRDFYDEYRSVLDVTEEFYLETLERVFFEHNLPKGTATFRGKLVPFDAVTDTALLTVEAENDDLCPPGQTDAAHRVCRRVPERKRQRLLQPGVGHYGIFSGSTFRRSVAPAIKDFIALHSG